MIMVYQATSQISPENAIMRLMESVLLLKHLLKELLEGSVGNNDA
jgi:hypothetical protein